MKRVMGVVMVGAVCMVLNVQAEKITTKSGAVKSDCKVMVSVNGGEMQVVTNMSGTTVIRGAIPADGNVPEGSCVTVTGSALLADGNVPEGSCGTVVATAMPVNGEMKKVTWLGVSSSPSSDELRAQLDLAPGVGLTVHGVPAGSPAAKAGLKVNDILTQLDGQLLMDVRQLRNLVIAKKAGDKVKLTYIRKGKTATTTVVLDAQEQTTMSGSAMIDLGSFDMDLNEVMGKMPGMVKGGCVKVITVGPDGVTTNMKDSKIGAKLTEALNQALSGNGSNVSVSVHSSVVGGGDISDVDQAKIAAQISEALKKAGIDNKKVVEAVQKSLDEALKNAPAK